MGVGVLGPLDIEGPTLSPRERTVIAALIVRRETPTSASELADALWGDDLPVTWQQQVRNAIARIRGKLGTDAIATVGSHYRLGLDPEAIDAVRFERLVAQARGHVLSSAPDRAIAEYQRALHLWRGTPYSDAGSWPPIEAESRRLETIRAGVEEELLDARLLAGETTTVIPDAERLVRDDPLREQRWATLAVANYRSDRQAEALAVLSDARRQLVDDLGIDPSHRLAQLEIDILRQAPELDPPSPAMVTTLEGPAACPYRGLSPFEADDRALFFGREADTRTLLERCRPRSVVAIVGASGSGKSSLLRAGLVPQLREQGRSVRVVVPTEEGLAELANAWLGSPGVVCIDQAEELVGATPEAVSALGRAAAEWVARGGCLILTIRSDFIDRALQIDAIGTAIGQGVYALAPLDEQRLRDTIIRPAETTGARLETGLVDVILRDAAGHPGILPALSYALAATWRHRDGATLTIDGYGASGGIAGAIAQSAEKVYHSLDADAQQVCHSLMMRLVERTPDGDAVRRRVPLSAVSSDPTRRAVIERLVAARLVTIDGDSIALAHEAVARTWPRLDDWLTEGAENAAVLRRIESAATAWQADGFPTDDLLRGGRLHYAIEWRETTHPELTDVEAAFLDAAVDQQRDEVRELTERAHGERRNVRRLRWALAAVAALLVASLGLGTVAAVRNSEAQAAAEDASIEALAATSLSVGGADRDIAALLAAELYRRWPDDSRARSALLGAATASGGRTARFHLGDKAMAVGGHIPGTRTFALVLDPWLDGDGPGQGAQPAQVWIMDIDTGEMIRQLDVTLPPLERWFGRVAMVSADGSTLLVHSPAKRDPDAPHNTCCINRFDAIDLVNGTRFTETIEVDSRVAGHFVLSPDGTRAYLVHEVTGDPAWLDTRTGEAFIPVERDPQEYEGGGDERSGIVLIDDEVYVGHESEIRVHHAETLEQIRTLELPRAWTSNQLLLDDGDGGVLGFGWEGAVRVDRASGRVMWDRPAEPHPCATGAVSDGTVLCLFGIGPITELDLETGRPTGRVFDTAADWNAGIQVIEETREFVTFHMHWPASVETWRLDGWPSVTRQIAPGHAAADGFGANDTVIITAPFAEEGSTEHSGPRLWDVRSGTQRGEASDVLFWLSDSVVARAEGSSFDQVGHPTASAFILENVEDSSRHTLDIGTGDEELWLFGGGAGEYGFAFLSDRIVAFDAATGKRVGTDVRLDFNPLYFIFSMSELPGTPRFVMTWWDHVNGRALTAVYDFSTGERVSRPSDEFEVAVGLPDGDILAANATRILRNTGEFEPRSALPNPGTKPVRMQSDASGKTLLVGGNTQQLSLYDLVDDRRLGGTISDGFRGGSPRPEAFLSSDGTQMVTSFADGVVLWDLRSEALRDAACRMAGRNLTELEWASYFDDEPYVATCADVLPSVPAE